MHSTHARCSSERGFALLEVLISVLLFSIGILGIVGIVGTSMRVSNDARYRAEAVNLADSIVADIWNTAPAQLDSQFGSTGPKLAAWRTKTAELLPATSGTSLQLDITQPGLSLQSRSIVITVSWQLPGAAEIHSYVTTAQIGKNP